MECLRQLLTRIGGHETRRAFASLPEGAGACTLEACDTVPLSGRNLRYARNAGFQLLPSPPPIANRKSQISPLRPSPLALRPLPLAHRRDCKPNSLPPHWPLMGNEFDSPLDKLWKEYSVIFHEFD